MQADFTLIRKALSRDLMEILIRFILIAFLVVISVKIFSPFMGLMLWAVVPAAGLIGLFVGAVFLALGYVVFMDWLAGGEAEDANLAGEDNKQSAVASE